MADWKPDLPQLRLKHKSMVTPDEKEDHNRHFYMKIVKEALLDTSNDEILKVIEP